MRLVGMLRFIRLHRSLQDLWKNSLGPVGYKSKKDGAYVLILGTDPNYRGKGLSSKLLRWRIEQHKVESPQRPIFIETDYDRTAKLYERVGFREIGRCTVDIDRSKILQLNRDEEFLQIALLIKPEEK